MEGGDKGLCPGGRLFTRSQESLSGWHFRPIPNPFLPLTRPSLELVERRTESHPGRSSVPAEDCLLPTCKLGLGLGKRGSEGGKRAQDLELAVSALGGKGRSGEDERCGNQGFGKDAGGFSKG